MHFALTLRWIVFRLVSFAMLLSVVGAFTWANVSSFGGRFSAFGLWSGIQVYQYGWPLCYFHRIDEIYITPPPTTPPLWSISSTTSKFVSHAVAINIVVGLMAVAATAIRLELWLRTQRKPTQFTLRTLFVLTTIVGIFLAAFRSPWAVEAALGGEPFVRRLLSFPIYVSLPLSFSLGCVLYLVGCLSFQALQRVAKIRPLTKHSQQTG